RAAEYDAENRFFTETLEVLRARGYLKVVLPEEFGGHGAGIVGAQRLQRRLASADPAAALGVNMHLIITGAARLAVERGLESARPVLELAGSGELFGFGISEAGNDLMLFDSLSSAKPAEAGSYTLSGTKIFTSMAHAWTRLVVHAKLADEERLVFGILERTPTVEVMTDW